MLQMATEEEVSVWFRTSNYAALQEHINTLASNKEVWDSKFIEFLGITDERVRLICENDRAVLIEKAKYNSSKINSYESASNFQGVSRL